jgi:uncharacterized pyridoxamine 5'-phosphate oxidase family protein
MDYNQEYINIVKNTAILALATSVKNIPNVRIVNYCFETNKPGILYFSTLRTSPKTEEFEINNKVSITTIPAPSDGHIHVRSKHAIVQKSKYVLEDLKELFISQIPGYAVTFSTVGKLLDVYEIHIKEALVILGPNQIGGVSF